MNKLVLFISVLSLSGIALAAAPAKQDAAANQNASATQKSPAAPAPAQQFQEVAYDDLGKYLNKPVVVRTTLRTERRGVLIKHSGTAINLKLDTGAVLGIPREQIRAVMIPIAPPDPLFPEKK